MTKDQVYSNRVKPSEVSVSSGSKFVGAVFLYVFIALAITSVTAALMGALFNFAIFKGSEAAADLFVSVLLFSLFAYIPVMLWAHFSARRNGSTMKAAYVCYSIVMGVFISSFTLLVPFYLVAVSFGLTCLTFGLMALIAWNTKKSLSGLALAASGLFFGALMMIGFNLILSLFGLASGTSWLISFVILIAVIMITIVDLKNVKEIAINGGATNNVALMCALNLYVDFIYIFIRILEVVIRLNANRR